MLSITICAITVLPSGAINAAEETDIDMSSARSGWLSNAKYIKLGGARERGSLSGYEAFQSYKFQTSVSGKVRLSVAVYASSVKRLTIYDGNGEEVETYSLSYNENIGYKVNYADLNLYPGTYYAVVSTGSYNTANQGQYYMDTQFNTSNSSFNYIHNSYASAPLLNFNQKYNDMININLPGQSDDLVYKVLFTNIGNYKLDMLSYIKDGLKVEIYDANGNEANIVTNYSTYGDSYRFYVDEITGAGFNSFNANLNVKQKGYYYIVVKKNSYTENHGNLSLTIKSNGAIKLNKTSTSVFKMKGYSTTLKATTNMSGKIKWSSSNSKVATVTQNGTITGVGVGKAVIRASLGGVTVSCNVVVANPSMTITQTDVSIKRGQSSTVKVRPFPTNTKVVFTSTNKSVATVTSSGSIKGIKKGTCRIKVSANGVSRYINVKVL